MRTYTERTCDVRNLLQKKKKNRIMTTATCLTLAAAIVLMVLFVPYSTTPPSVSRYAGSAYYDVICRLNDITFQRPVYKNNFEALTGELRFSVSGGASADDMPAMDAEIGVDSFNKQEYVEVTDNQVQGVTEADIFKRSDRYVYYLRGAELSVYDIQGENSRLVAAYTVDAPLEAWDEKASDDDLGEISDEIRYFRSSVMYLSQDCGTVTLVMSGYSDTMGLHTVLINVDVADPANIRETGRVYFTGEYVSSRNVDGRLLLTQNFSVGTPDFDEPATFVPSYGVPENMTCIEAENILCPDTAEAGHYTAVYSLDAATLAVEGSVAMLGYSQELYVSGDTIYATHLYDAYTPKDADGYSRQSRMTDITGIFYADGLLTVLGTVSLEGGLKDQYSMDQYDGVLRVVTTTRTWDHWSEGGYERVSFASRNVNLYCINAQSFEVIASVRDFAPEGEEATAVRFDGAAAYVCTAEIVTLTDPVYFFDLSDPENITYTDTGAIDGYSTSLIQLGDGYLLGIGYGDERQLKVEVYAQGEDGVISVCEWELYAYFCEAYKTYYIDRERNLIGLALQDYSVGKIQYVLLHFDGYGLNPVMEHTFYQSVNWNSVRAFLAEEYFYILEENNGLAVMKLNIFG